MFHDGNSEMACKVPYYYSELKKGAAVEAEKNNLNKVENPYEKGHGFDNPLLAIEPDISTCDIPEKVATFQKKKKKKKAFATPVYRRSNSLITNGLMSPRTNYARKEVVSAGEGTAGVPQKSSEQCHKRRSSEPNIYEEIPEQSHEDSCYSGSIKGFTGVPRWPPGTTRSRDCDRSSTYSSKVVLDEVEKVQQRHAQILENLNLDVEAMLMPEDAACSEDLCSEGNKPPDHSATLEAKASHVLSPGTPPLYFASSRWQGAGTLPKPATASLGRRVMNEYILQQSDFCPGSKTTGGRGQKSLQTPEDNIYEEVDLQQITQTDEDFADTVSWIDSEAGIDQSASSASEEIEEETSSTKLAARFIGKKKKTSKKGKENEV
ncbi:hypothetical protein X975_11041, partial [Stegodyphus mimosarum]